MLPSNTDFEVRWTKHHVHKGLHEDEAVGDDFAHFAILDLCMGKPT